MLLLGCGRKNTIRSRWLRRRGQFTAVPVPVGDEPKVDEAHDQRQTDEADGDGEALSVVGAVGF